MLHCLLGFAHYLRAVILRTPRVAAAVTATAAATSSDGIGSTTFGRATKRKWATGWGGVGTREIYNMGRRERAHLAIDVVHRLGVHGRHDEAAEGGADRLDERDEVLVARDDSRAVVRGRDAVDDRPAAVLGERAVQPVGHDLGYLEDGRLVGGARIGRGRCVCVVLGV